MSDHNERPCAKCGSLLHHEDDCTEPRPETPTPKHTPGPWIHNAHVSTHPAILGADAKPIARTDPGRTDEERKANAELIAFAPMLLEKVSTLERENATLTKQLEEATNFCICAYCKERMPKYSDAVMLHMQECTKHPLGDALRSEVALKEQLAKCESEWNTMAKEADAQVAALRAELEQAKEWKRQALIVMPDFQAIGKALELPIGTDVWRRLLPDILALRTRAETAERELLQWRILAQEMTPGGSEYMDREVVRKYYREFKDSAHRAKLDFYKQQAALTTVTAERDKYRNAFADANDARQESNYQNELALSTVTAERDALKVELAERVSQFGRLGEMIGDPLGGDFCQIEEACRELAAFRNHVMELTNCVSDEGVIEWIKGEQSNTEAIFRLAYERDTARARLATLIVLIDRWGIVRWNSDGEEGDTIGDFQRCRECGAKSDVQIPIRHKAKCNVAAALTAADIQPEETK